MRSVTLAGCCTALIACGGNSTGTNDLAFSATPSQQVLSERGALELSVYEVVGQPVGRGVNVLKLLIGTPAGSTEGRVTVDLSTWMPAMGHGSAVTPTAEPIEGGFVVTEISFPMAGTWQLRATFGGAVSDHAILSFDIQ